jgi:hypothetical protein
MDDVGRIVYCLTKAACRCPPHPSEVIQVE